MDREDAVKSTLTLGDVRKLFGLSTPVSVCMKEIYDGDQGGENPDDLGGTFGSIVGVPKVFDDCYLYGFGPVDVTCCQYGDGFAPYPTMEIMLSREPRTVSIADCRGAQAPVEPGFARTGTECRQGSVVRGQGSEDAWQQDCGKEPQAFSFGFLRHFCARTWPVTVTDANGDFICAYRRVREIGDEFDRMRVIGIGTDFHDNVPLLDEGLGVMLGTRFCLSMDVKANRMGIVEVKEGNNGGY